MQYSQYGTKFAQPSGILELMEDLDSALNRGDGNALMLGGGNPGRIPAVERELRSAMDVILNDGDRFERMIGFYDGPQGNGPFIELLADLLSRTYGWPLSPAHIALTNGSQNSFFHLFNLFAGRQANKTNLHRVLLPLVPEYIGYSDTGIDSDVFLSLLPRIQELPDRTIKYQIDFEAVEEALQDYDIGAICVSRPTNPSGNVIEDYELNRLSLLSQHSGIPLIVDGAYGHPFPGLIYTGATPHWDDHIVYTLSLSKFGMPGVRTGIIIANPEIITMLTRMNAVNNLASGSVGPVLATELIRRGSLITLSTEVIRKFYREKADRARNLLLSCTEDLPDVRMHKIEGAFFLWVYCHEFPATTGELYTRLKKRGVYVVPGKYYFPGLADDWPHKEECLRVSFAGEDRVVEQGLKIIAEELRSAYATGRIEIG
ncbi:MAG: valine--pyruvate transaminase [Leptospiraceae bacterium]|nr:valine--pyruvate transaminase [Leptospiraceae bacterium]